MIITSPCTVPASEYIDMLLGNKATSKEIGKFVKYVTNNQTSLNFMRLRSKRASGYSYHFQLSVLQEVIGKVSQGDIFVGHQKAQDNVLGELKRKRDKIDLKINKVRKNASSASKIQKMNGCDDWQTQRLLCPAAKRIKFTFSNQLNVAEGEGVKQKCRREFDQLYHVCCLRKYNTNQMLTYMARKGYNIDTEKLIVTDTRESIRSYGEVKCLTDTSPVVVYKVNRAVDFAKKYNLSVDDTVKLIKSHVPEYDVVFIEGHYNAIHLPPDSQTFTKPACFIDVTRKK